MQTPSISPFVKRIASAALAAALLPLAMPLSAQITPPQPRAQVMGGEQDRLTLNQEQAQFARAQLMRNAEQQAEYERKLAEVEAAKARIAADDAAAKAAYEAEKARIDAQYAAAVAKWEADVAACSAGDRRRCSGG
jgi:hypothetical protein